MEDGAYHGGHEVIHPDCPYCLQVRAARAYGGGRRSSRGKVPTTRLERERARHRRAVLGYAAVSLFALIAFSVAGGILGFTYFRDERAKASESVSPPDTGSDEAAGPQAMQDAAPSRLSPEDEEIVRYLAVEYAAGLGYPGLAVRGISSNGVSASVTLADPAGAKIYTVEMVRGGRTHEWLKTGFREGA